MLDDFKQLLIVNVRQQLNWVSHSKARNNINVSCVLLIHERMKSMHHHVESGPTVPLSLGYSSVKI